MIAIFTLSLLGLGYLGLSALFPGRHFGFAEGISLSFAVGATLAALVTFAVGLAGFEFTPAVLGVVFSVALVKLGLISWHQHFARIRRPDFELLRGSLGSQLLAILLFILIAEKVAVAGMIALGPTYFDDAAANWNARPQILAEVGKLPTGDPAAWNFLGGRKPDYPLLVPLVRLDAEVVLGHWSESIKLLDTAAMIALLLAVFALARRALAALPALGVTFVVSAMPLLAIHGGAGYADIWVAMFLGTMLLALDRAIGLVSSPSETPLRSAALAGFLLGAAAFAKNDALMIDVLPVFVALGIAGFVRSGGALAQFFSKLRHDAYRPLLAALVGFVISAGPWLVVKSTFDLKAGWMTSGEGSQSLLAWHVPEGLPILGISFFTAGNYGIIWPILILLGVAALPSLLRDRGNLPALALGGLAFGAAISVFLLTPYFAWLENQTTIHRVMLQLLPILAMLATLALREMGFGEGFAGKLRGFLTRRSG